MRNKIWACCFAFTVSLWRPSRKAPRDDSSSCPWRMVASSRSKRTSGPGSALTKTTHSPVCCIHRLSPAKTVSSTAY